MMAEPDDPPLMRRALALAVLGRGWVNPNPMVGAVVVRAGEVVGEGYTQPIGGAHAEVVALDAAGDRARGGTLYVTLEPCNHQGRTPPCTLRVIAAGVRRVVVGCADQNPLTAGQARAVLEAAGITVEFGVEESACQALNEPFFKYIRTGWPHVICKMAQSLDGKIATPGSRNQTISGPEAHELVQEWRATVSAVMVGIGTVLADDPRLSCRLPGSHQPSRVIVDPLARTPSNALCLEPPAPTYIAVGLKAAAPEIARLEAVGALILHCAPRGQDLDLEDLMGQLARKELSSLLLEGGGGLNARAFRQGIVDRVAFFIAPLLIGGRSTTTAMEGPDLGGPLEGIRLGPIACRTVGADLLVEAQVC